jgi:DNA-directed RNA polymerase subunit beta'
MSPTIEYIKINLASPERIRQWSERRSAMGNTVGQVLHSGTLSYKTLKPEMHGLLCEQIFGSIKSWECHCGKYKNSREPGIFCEICGVEPADNLIRRYRMGFIHLESPVTHIWYLKGRPSRISKILGLRLKDLINVVYFHAYIVLYKGNATELEQGQVLSDEDYVVLKYQEDLRGKGTVISCGAEAIKVLLHELNLPKICIELRREFSNINIDLRELENLEFDEQPEEEKLCQGWDVRRLRRRRDSIIRRLRIVEQFLGSENDPTWMILSNFPVLPPDLRPIVQLDGGGLMSSDLNELYRRLLHRNKRLQRLKLMLAPELLIRNDKRLLQDAVDQLLDNSKCEKPFPGKDNRPLKSLSDTIRGKEGRIRLNLLGKRVDYSGRSVIIAGPELAPTQCGLPQEMAVELFFVFVAHILMQKFDTINLYETRNLLKTKDSAAISALKDVAIDHVVLLNRAPTLHRMGIQAFEPVIINERAIKLHPLVCTGFNADFDGDQMAVHIPLSLEAQTEARMLMLAPNNFLSPANGQPNISPSQDMVLGNYYLTVENPWDQNPRETSYFPSVEDVFFAYESGLLKLHTFVWVRCFDGLAKSNINCKTKEFNYVVSTKIKIKEKLENQEWKVQYIRTTPGRIIFNRMFN